jgi:hypothetical protein
MQSFGFQLKIAKLRVSPKRLYSTYSFESIMFL